MNKYRIIPILFLLSVLFSVSAENSQVINLHGKWSLYLNKENKNFDQIRDIPFNDWIELPQTLDQAQKGFKSAMSNETMRMMRKYSYYGKAWYQRKITIPQSWTGRKIELLIERTRPTHIFVDGKPAGSSLVISAPQLYDLSGYLKPGEHTLTVLVDNGTDCGLPKEIGSSHMWSDDTQTNWNGLLGKIELVSQNSEVCISDFRITAHAKLKSVSLQLKIRNNTSAAIDVNLVEKKLNLNKPVRLQPGENKIEISAQLPATTKLWSEYTPSLTKINVEVVERKKTLDVASVKLGLRDFGIEAKSFSINGQKIFLRGKHDACVFTETGYAPMDKKGWIHYFRIVKEYGFNHVRFHSWCPPEEAFEVADELGVYLQPELPFWGLIKDDPNDATTQFLISEGKAILDAYGNHPSFVMFSLGNELWGEMSGLRYIVNQLKVYDARPFYTMGSNYHLGWSGEQDGDDFMVTCRVGGYNDDKYESHVRSSFSFADAIDGGILNASYPNSVIDFSKALLHTTKPVISHETGQFQMYPDRNDLKNYHGILAPVNFDIFVKRIEKAKGPENYKKYFDATAALSLICYKADMEMMRRTKDLAGFQMLDLQDYPGQGTAIVGILNASMKSKGIISAADFHARNNDILPLWISDSFSFDAGMQIKSALKISNNSLHSIQNESVEWKLVTDDKNLLAKGKILCNAPAGELSDAYNLNIQLPHTEKAMHCVLTLDMPNSKARNSYDLWIYPVNDKPLLAGDQVKLFTQYDESLQQYLSQGGTALLMPDHNTYPDQTVGGLFITDYWNFSMFKTISENAGKPVSPGTMGLLIDQTHPIFKDFPTETYSNWQWWPAVKASNPLILDKLADKIHPIVETIDNVERMHFLGLMFECRVGEGKILVCMADLKNHLNYKENKQLYRAMIGYMNSDQFVPKDSLTPEELKDLFTSEKKTDEIKGVKNVSYN